MTIYGHHPVLEAIQAGKPVEKVFFQQGIRGDFEKEVRHLCRDFSVPLQVVPKNRLDKITKFKNHQGIAAFLSVVLYQTIEDVLPLVYEKGETPLLLLLDRVTDVRNFGGIVRTAVCSGVHAVIIPQSEAAPANEDALRASAGALARAVICREKSLFKTVEYLQQSGVQVVATGLTDAAKPIYETDLKTPTAILMGAEGEGLHPKLLSMSDEVAIIPQGNAPDGEVFDSFNVGVAAGICLYEAMRQRNGAV